MRTPIGRGSRLKICSVWVQVPGQAPRGYDGNWHTSDAQTIGFVDSTSTIPTMNFEERVKQIKAEQKAWPLRKKISVATRRLKNKVRTADYFWVYRVKQWRGRIKNGYSYRDLWSFDVYIAGVLSKALIELRDIGHGYPADEGMTPEKWHDILTEMAEGFEAWTHIFDNEAYGDNWKEWQEDIDKKLKSSFELMSKWFGNLWD